MLNKFCKIIVIALVMFSPCSCKFNDGRSEQPVNSTNLAEEIDTTDIQDIMNELVTGSPIRKVIPGEGIYEARLGINKGDYVNIATPMDCFIREKLVHQGQHVQKGKLMFVLDHPELYTLQSAYLETKEKINYFQQELQRKGDLSLDFAASMKSFQLAESEYRSMLSVLKGYERKIEFLGISADSIINSGMVDDIRIYAPRGGIVISAGVEKGEYLSIGNQLAGIASLQNLTAESKVNIKDAGDLETRNDLFFTPVNKALSYPVTLEGKSPFLYEDQTLLMRFQVKNHDDLLLPGMNGWITVDGIPEFLVFVPVESTITFNEDRFIFILHKNTIKRFFIQPGIESEGLLEVKNADKLPDEAVVVNEGAGLIHSRMLTISANAVEIEE